ncbi:MAG TPA: hypothetical protein VK136_10360 [Bacillota bacterium]|nr:hypothetical protein [Bacillota bacterium]
MGPKQSETNDHIDIWGDHVNVKDLIISMILCIAFALGGYLLAFGNTPPLIFGLIGAVIGFIISSIIIKPKRHITVTEDGERS